MCLLSTYALESAINIQITFFLACHASKYRSRKLISTSILKDPTSNVPFLWLKGAFLQNIFKENSTWTDRSFEIATAVLLKVFLLQAQSSSRFIEGS